MVIVHNVEFEKLQDKLQYWCILSLDLTELLLELYGKEGLI